MDLKIDFTVAGGDGCEVVRYQVDENCWDAWRTASNYLPVWVDVVEERVEGWGLCAVAFILLHAAQ